MKSPSFPLWLIVEGAEGVVLMVERASFEVFAKTGLTNTKVGDEITIKIMARVKPSLKPEGIDEISSIFNCYRQ